MADGKIDETTKKKRKKKKMNYYIDCLTKKYACFSGRARRQEFWLFALFNGIATIILQSVTGFLVGITGLTVIVAIPVLYTLAVILPNLAVFVRRMHDIGKSGWWWLIGFVPFVGGIVLLVFCCLDSQPGENAYGPNPKGL